VKLEDLRNKVKNGFKTRRTCGVTFCSKYSTTNGYCKDHIYECRTRGCSNRVSRLNAKCSVCSRRDNQIRLKEIKKVR
jgi:hypothetical protein